MQELIIVSRTSKLAMWQSEYIKARLENKHKIKTSIISLNTKGDLILDKALSKIGGKGLFTKELEEKLLNKEAHLAVHSLKDVPAYFENGLMLVATCKRENPNDAFLSENYESLEKLPKGAIVGTTSLRRKLQLKLIRPDLVIKDLRGNVNTRLDKLKKGEYDAIILAMAGIVRLDLFKEVKYIKELSTDIMIPAAGQGILGIECKIDEKISSLLGFLNDEKAMMESTIERDFTRVINAGCGAPIGIHAKVGDKKIEINAILGLIDGSKVIKKQILVDINEYKTAGINLAEEFIKLGAKEILEENEKLI